MSPHTAQLQQQSSSTFPARPAGRPYTVLIAALGGEGGGVLAEWLVEVALRCGYYAQSTSIPGVAQRTGATTYYVEIHPEPLAVLGGRRPILSLAPAPGGVDLFIASELLEAVRYVANGLVSPDRSLVIASTSRTLTTAERMQMGDGRMDEAALVETLHRHSQRCIAFDIAAATRAAGTAPSAVMFGAIAASGLLPFAREEWERVVRESGRGVEASLRGFARAWDVVRAGGEPEAVAPPAAAAAPTGAIDGFPAEVQDMLVPGLARVQDYQDAAYGRLYLERVRQVLEAERRSDPAALNGYALTRETARFLALWMAFDDIVRVARLKCSASRFSRVRSEVKAGEGDLLRIVDLFKPGIPEIAGLLPPGLERRLVRWEARRRAAGKPPFGFSLHLSTTSVSGFLALRFLAGLRGLRRRGVRFGREQAMIEHWLTQIRNAAAQDWRCALEIALCGRLVKGYGSTNDRGRENLAHILDHLAAVAMPPEAKAEAVRKAREAALADEGGQALDRVLIGNGAPPRPVKAQPVVWLTRKAGSAAGR
ncbi:indolepyruvate oxidoreductase subunit beta family protein [Azoarcus indigens]|uniref:Indolepyruvate ferredoxin oxidoreductase beta subunit n=1 Tax=Azoarcus indigens TaxID=29545 RepID=A0A4R6EFU2_9RHOO|nr:indolepyruvate oxidoreductase subunit beta family protein [Azoarcus indigens]NMG67345.1 indolepyruvate oxidoreductase subunit beta family protein [Azoarcus indigens]TDN57165.1 indolepyruvate ferredoxin oxidoreductase beta subunit [Azoarcus indigens]